MFGDGQFLHGRGGIFVWGNQRTHRTRLEVLPSFYNVFKGDMSLAEMLQDV